MPFGARPDTVAAVQIMLDTELGVMLMDRFTYYTLKYTEHLSPNSSVPLGSLVSEGQVCGYRVTCLAGA